MKFLQKKNFPRDEKKKIAQFLIINAFFLLTHLHLIKMDYDDRTRQELTSTRKFLLMN